MRAQIPDRSFLVLARLRTRHKKEVRPVLVSQVGSAKCLRRDRSGGCGPDAFRAAALYVFIFLPGTCRRRLELCGRSARWQRTQRLRKVKNKTERNESFFIMRSFLQMTGT